MRKVDELLARYGEFHRNPVNKIVDWISLLVGPVWLLGFLYKRLGIEY